MIKQDILEDQAKNVFLGIGSNLGKKLNNINNAKFKLESHRVKIIKCSGNYETLSWPNSRNPKFINIVLQIKTHLSPIELLNLCKRIEKELGRKKTKKNEPRTCDIDIIDYDQKVFKLKGQKPLYVPHPEIYKRSFVLLPLYEISKSWKHPETKKNIIQLINSLKTDDLRTIKQI